MQYELLDLVDENDVVIGVLERNDVYKQGLTNFRVINAFIKNNEGKLWIPRRQANKRLFPLSLDVSVGGHVTSGETYDEPFAKEASEELNLDVSKVSYKLLGKLTPHDDGVSAFMHVYEIHQDEAPQYNPEDFTEYYWLTTQEVMERLAQGDISKGDMTKLLKKFYL